jgi:hypothetical protein
LIVLARKPLSESTVAGNVLRWGTGAINISACRVRTADDSNGGNGRSHTSDQRTSIQNIEHQQMFAQQHAERDCLLSNAIERARGDQLPLNSIGDCLTCPHCGDELPRAFPSCPRRAHILAGLSMPSGNNTAPDIERQGRWPANVIHDGSAEVLAAFPDVHGAGAARNGSSEPRESNHENITSWSKQSSTGDMFRIGDSGSAARFFYTSKADSDDRLGSKHPTVKPLDLMQYLVRLVTPPRGICLDPFAGTGTTGEAAWREGMRAVLIEAEPEYQADIRRRMALALAGPDERSRESIRARNLPRDDGP